MQCSSVKSTKHFCRLIEYCFCNILVRLFVSGSFAFLGFVGASSTHCNSYNHATSNDCKNSCSSYGETTKSELQRRWRGHFLVNSYTKTLLHVQAWAKIFLTRLWTICIRSFDFESNAICRNTAVFKYKYFYSAVSKHIEIVRGWFETWNSCHRMQRQFRLVSRLLAMNLSS